MNNAQTIIDALCEQALHPALAVAKSCRDAGKDAVGCFPIYTPEELVYAAGFLPVGMWGGSTEIKLADRYLQGFCCSIMRSNIEYGMRGTYNRLRAVLLPTLCDTLKCICENWKVAVSQLPVIPVVYPQNRSLPAGEQYLKDEFSRVRLELEKLAGHPITDEVLEKAFALYEDWRSAMREFCEAASTHPNTINAKVRHLVIKAGWFLDKAVHLEKIRALTAALKELPEEPCAVRVVATGLMAEPVGVLNLMVENDMAIVADDLAQESRQFRTPARLEGDALSRMAWRVLSIRVSSSQPRRAAPSLITSREHPAANFLSLNFFLREDTSMSEQDLLGRIRAAAPIRPVSSSAAKRTFSISWTGSTSEQMP